MAQWARSGHIGHSARLNRFLISGLIVAPHDIIGLESKDPSVYDA